MYGLSRECLFNGENSSVDCALKHWRNQNFTCMKDGTYSHQRRLTLARHCDVTKALDSLRLNVALHHICICYFPTSPVQYLTLSAQSPILNHVYFLPSSANGYQRVRPSSAYVLFATAIILISQFSSQFLPSYSFLSKMRPTMI